MKKFFRSLNLLGITKSILLLIILSCAPEHRSPVGALGQRSACIGEETNSELGEIPYFGKGFRQTISFDQIRADLNSACQSCHLAPAEKGGFSYVDAFHGRTDTIGGKTKNFPGFYEMANSVDAVMTDGSAKQMPPLAERQANPLASSSLRKRVKAWILAGRPESEFSVDPKNSSSVDDNSLSQRTELGSCIPLAKAIGTDSSKDLEFEKLSQLPQDLADTDLFSLDPTELAARGTVAYNVAYPLWADNSDKGRWLHLPNVKGKRQPLNYRSGVNLFDVPPNTRLYKTFYKRVKLAGVQRFKRIETRIIVVRSPWQNSLFGSYRWDSAEQSAKLITTPYRDGTVFKDSFFDLLVDDEKQVARSYAIPGRQRCIECHMGSESKNFVLGLTPLQLNHRQAGEGGRSKPLAVGELNQIDRFISYGFIENAPSREQWPKLENLGTVPPRNEFELKAQAYVVGNCAHCHNPAGLAMTKENGVKLLLTPGALFGFNTLSRSTQISTRPLVHHDGELDQSHIWRKINDLPQALSLSSRMPMNTPGAPDCEALKVIGQWIRSFESIDAAAAFNPTCANSTDLGLIDEDFTEPSSSSYIPKRSDWNNRVSGMPEKFRQLLPSASLKAAMGSKYAIGYWVDKPLCKFPDVAFTAGQIRPWMIDANGFPKRPFGEVYSTTPGSWFYRTSCQKCHGANADGNSALARGILTWSGGSVRVANFMTGMFGNGGANLKLFQSGSENLASQYLIWMAMEGTQVKFPPELTNYLGRHGGQMLNVMREKCLNQIALNTLSSPRFMDHEIFNQVCFSDNLTPTDPSLSYDPNTGKPVDSVAVESWADRAAANIGFAIFDFLEQFSKGTAPLGNDQCENIFSH